jgi:hypothetical protein
MRRGGTRRPSAAANTAGGGGHGAGSVLLSPLYPTASVREKAEEGEKETGKGLIGGCRMDLPGPTTSVGTRIDYSVGPWDYPACTARYMMA